jgi:hypothetical protein
VSRLGRLASGWEIGSIVSVATGRPYSALLSSSKDNSGQDRVYQRPDCNAAPIYNYSDPTQNYITNFAAVFSKPADGTIGTCGRNAFRGPHFIQWDANLNKTTKINERLSLQLRWEVFNVLNHPNFNAIPSSTTYTSSSFGNFSQTPDVASGNPFLSVVTELSLFAQAPPIYGGTDQVQRNIIGERVLGLPKEPNNDKIAAFKDLPKNA